MNRIALCRRGFIAILWAPPLGISAQPITNVIPKAPSTATYPARCMILPLRCRLHSHEVTRLLLGQLRHAHFDRGPGQGFQKLEQVRLFL